MEIEQEYKREVGEEDELMSWELIPQHVLEMSILPLLPIHSLIRFGRVCREWNKLFHSWEFIRPFLLQERSEELLKFCLLKRIVPLPKGVETLEKEDGSVVHTVSAWKWPFLLAVAAPVQVMEGSSHWEIRIWELVMNDVSA
ncbi:hypothetical protein SUGI_1087420 [Cryptomeria japonica]|nr:hypothetical protein SUGI_1087420 [Cryptomeria japonica]